MVNSELLKKEEEAIKILKNVYSKAANPFIAFTGGKDSLATLYLVKRVANHPMSVLFIDTSAHFEEIYLFIGKMQKLWGFNLINERNEEALRTIKIAGDKGECCGRLKVQVLKNAIKKYNIDYLFTGIRRDEDVARRNEDYISSKEDHIRVNPIVYFTEKDVWEYIKKYNLPYCSLYDKGYRSIDCAPCSKPAEGPAERSGRAQDKEAVMDKLRKLGYF